MIVIFKLGTRHWRSRMRSDAGGALMFLDRSLLSGFPPLFVCRRTYEETEVAKDRVGVGFCEGLDELS